MSHERKSSSDEYYTPKYIFDALGVSFHMDAASPKNRVFCHVPATQFITEKSLQKQWKGFVWCNPPFEGRNDKRKWLEKMFLHGRGIVLVPDRTSASWWQDASQKCDAMLMIKGKIKFIVPGGSTRNQPSNGTTLFAYGKEAVNALLNAEKTGLGTVLIRHNCL